MDYTVGDTVYIKFTTRAFATGIPTTLAGSPVLSAYEDASVTQITAGVSITADLDGVTGLNLATIVATGGNGFESGKHYGIAITTGTVGGVSVVGEVIGQFKLADAWVANLELMYDGTGYTADSAPSSRDQLAAVKAETALIVADTNELQSDDIPGLIGALNDVSVADLLTTQMTEDYAADGTAPTLAQAMFLVLQQAGEFSISGTTITVKKLDGSTTAATFTLNDGTNPTSRTRAT